MKTKWLALLLSLVLLITMCAACSKKDGNNGGNDGNDTLVTTTTTVEGDTDSTTTRLTVPTGNTVGTATRTTVKSGSQVTGEVGGEAFKMGGTITLMAGWDLTPSGDSNLDKKLVASMERVRKKYDVKFKFAVEAIDDLPSKMVAAAMSKQVLADVVLLRHTQAFPYMVSANLLKNLDNYIHSNYKMYNQTTFEVATVDGSLYGFSYGRGTGGNMTYYNKTMFQKNNWKTPQQYYAEGQWTWDNFAAVCAKIKNDTSGSIWGCGMLDYGKIDIILPTFGGDFMAYSNKKFQSKLVSQNNIDALTYLNKITYVDKVVEPRPDSASWDYDIWEFCDGKYGMLLTDASALKKVNKNLKDEFGLVPMPMANSKIGHMSVVNAYNVYTMPQTVSDTRAKQVMQVLEDLYTPYNLADSEIYDESPYVYDEESQAVLDNEHKILKVTSQRGLNEYYSLLLPALVDGVKNTGGAAAALQGVNSGWQKALDDSLSSYYG